MKKITPHRDWLLQRCRQADFTLKGLVSELAERGLKIDARTVNEFVHEEKLRIKKHAAPLWGPATPMRAVRTIVLRYRPPPTPRADRNRSAAR